jgi:hypothetical protein
MRMVRRWSGISKFAAALGIALWAGTDVSASTLIEYHTSGAIESGGVTGAPVISFRSLSDASVNSPSFLSLGDFQVAALPAGQSTTYSHVPFHITLIVDKVDGSTATPNETPIVITGELNGTTTGPKQSTVRATFNPSSTLSFQTGDFVNFLTVPGSGLLLVPSTTNNGVTTAEAHVRTVAQSIPEPTTVALFFTTLAGLGLRRYLSARRPV